MEGQYNAVPVFAVADADDVLPACWKLDKNRPLTAVDLERIKGSGGGLKGWVTSRLGGEDAPGICGHTDGSGAAGIERWNSFLAKGGIGNYAKSRNNPQKIHDVSRMSCYTNVGSVSIFRLVYDVMKAKGSDKFQDEILKWREGAYAYCLANPRHLDASVIVPQFASNWLKSQRIEGGGGAEMELAKLVECRSSCPTWNAMQRYLRDTGELHNNARMTWGKSAVGWLSKTCTAQEILDAIVHLNDYYALDGFSPPSYAGVSWCVGVGDKPAVGGGGISMKYSGSYKIGAAQFDGARAVLLGSAGSGGGTKRSSMDSFFLPKPKSAKGLDKNRD
jgi:hypothetical protein